MKNHVNHIVNELSRTMTTYEIIRYYDRKGEKQKLLDAIEEMPKYHAEAFRIALNYFPKPSRQNLERELDENKDIIYEMRGE